MGLILSVKSWSEVTRRTALGRDLGEFGALLFGGTAQQIDRSVGCILEGFQHQIDTRAKQHFGIAGAV